MQGPTTAEPSSRGGDTTTARIAARLDALADRIPLALALAVLGGVLLRILLELSYRPAVLSFPDSASYVAMATDSMFDDPTQTVGYPIFLELVHGISANFERTIELQHVFGLATAILLYAIVRRVGAPIWAALVGAAAVLFSLDQIQLEHTLASESPFTLVYAAGLYAAVRGLEPGRGVAGPVTTRELWLLGAGLLLGASIWIRAVAVSLIPFLVLWVAFATSGRWQVRAVRGAIAGLPALGLVLLYMVMNNAATGTFGLIQADGWTVYARTAQFADCSEFTPPDGTEGLCETSPPGERPAPPFYTSSPDSPAQRAFGPPPSEDADVGAFGWAAVAAQPLEYARTVGNDFLRYFFPDLNSERPFNDVGNELEISFRAPEIEQSEQRLDVFADYYEPVGPVEVTALAGALADIQQLVRVHPLLLLQAAILALVGLWFARGRVRAAIALLGGSALLMLAAGATATYAARYAIPISGPLMAAGALGLWALLERYGAARSPQPAATAS